MIGTFQQKRKITGTNLEFAGQHNRRAVLDLVRQFGTMSRADMARMTNLTQQTISNIVAELVESDLLIGGAAVRNARGQPSIPYTLNPQGAYSLGFHIHADAIVGVLTDLKSNVLSQRNHVIHKASPAQSTPLILSMIEELVSEAKIERAKILGAGIALPTRFGLGTISTEGPTGYPDWNNAEARTEFSKSLGLSVFIENDAVATAIFERMHGAAKSIENFVLIFLDEGLGAGLFLKGQPFKGASLNAGEIGHMIVVPNGRACACGNFGCLERYVSLRAAYECLEGTTEDPQNNAHFTIESHPKLDQWLGDAGQHLATAVNIFETLMDPETIIVAGRTTGLIIEKLIQSVAPLPVSVAARPTRGLPRLIAGTVGPIATAQGAAAIPIFQELNPALEGLMK